MTTKYADIPLLLVWPLQETLKSYGADNQLIKSIDTVNEMLMFRPQKNIPGSHDWITLQ
jgi:hypothetical protein